MRYVLNRLRFLLLTLWAVVTINFILPRLMPGNPALLMIARFHDLISTQALHALELQFGVTRQPLWVQYLAYLNNLVHGNFGLSLTYYPVPVTTVILNSLPWTLGLAGTATLFSAVVGTFIGIHAAWKRGGALDSTLPVTTTFTGAIPHQWLGIILLYFFGFTLSWFPLGHAYSTTMTPSWSAQFILNVLDHAILPGATMVIPTIGGWLLHMRNNMIQTLGDDYVIFGEAKGVKPSRLMYQYAARNAMLPSLTGFAMALGFVVGGAVLVEVVFSYPGIGYQLVNAVENEDYPLMQGLFLIIAVAVLVANFLVEILYAKLDPRVRRAGSSG